MGFWEIYSYSFVILIVYAIVCVITVKYSKENEIASLKSTDVDALILTFIILAVLGPLGLAIFYLDTLFSILRKWCKS